MSGKGGGRKQCAIITSPTRKQENLFPELAGRQIPRFVSNDACEARRWRGIPTCKSQL